MTVNGETREIVGKKFSKLDEETQGAIKNSELQIYELTDCTEKDVREMFRRQNAGKALSNGQLRTLRETDELSTLSFSHQPSFYKEGNYRYSGKERFG